MVEKCLKMNVLLACVVSVVFLMLTACGGGGGGGSGSSSGSNNAPVNTAPVISDLQLAPARAPVNADGKTSTLFGSFKFVDAKGDVTSVVPTILNASSANIDCSFDSTPNLSGQTQGTVSLSITISTNELGNYRLRIVVADSTGIQSNALEKDFKIIENPWTAKAVMPTPRAGLAAAVVGGRIYAVGGYNNPDESNPLRTLEEYNPESDTWTERAPMPTARNCLGMVSINGKLYAVGGLKDGVQMDTNEVYDPSTDTWTAKSPMPTARSDLAVVELNGKLYAIGGKNSLMADLTTVEEYDPATDTWTAKASMSTPRYSPAAGVLNGKIYAAGGTYVKEYNSSVEEYDPATDRWTKKAAIMSTNLEGSTGVVINGLFYVAGGAIGSADGGESNEMYRYDPAADVWEIQSRMLTARFDLSAGVLNDKIYVIGGRGAGGVFNAVEEYSPVKDN